MQFRLAFKGLWNVEMGSGGCNDLFEQGRILSSDGILYVKGMRLLFFQLFANGTDISGCHTHI